MLGVLAVLLLTACNDWLELHPENEQISDSFWETKEEVEAVLSAGYVKLRSSVEYLYVWGEVRADGVDLFGITVDDNIRAANRIRQMDILPNNRYAKWEPMYKIINMANSIIRYAPEVVEKDASFTPQEMQSFLSEAYFQRALAYFYLVRVFKEVPLILEPYVRDDSEYEVAKSSESLILNQIVSDLEEALGAAKEFFPEIDDEVLLNTKGRATKWAIYALLADIYLWQGEYDKCIEACDAIINSGRVGLITKNNWFSNFFPGNSNESVFEIQYSYMRQQTNSFLSWFNTQKKYIISTNNLLKFQDTQTLGDIRGLDASYTDDFRIWKYIGNEIRVSDISNRLSTENDQNFIIYRLADILLMKAEALVMKGNAHYGEATKIIARVRARAGIEEDLVAASTELDMLIMILDERARELFSEGKRWFDLLRVARRNDYEYKNYMISQVLTVVPLNSVAIVTSKLMDENSYYLPIHRDELNNNRLLEQNPYYAGLEN